MDALSYYRVGRTTLPKGVPLRVAVGLLTDDNRIPSAGPAAGPRVPNLLLSPTETTDKTREEDHGAPSNFGPSRASEDGRFLFEVPTQTLPAGSFELLIRVGDEERAQLPEEVWVLERADYENLLDEAADEGFFPSPSLRGAPAAADYVENLIHERLLEDGFGADVPSRFHFRRKLPEDSAVGEFPLNPLRWTAEHLVDEFRDLALFGVEDVTWTVELAGDHYALRCDGELLEPLSVAAVSALLEKDGPVSPLSVRKELEQTYVDREGGGGSSRFSLAVSHSIEDIRSAVPRTSTQVAQQTARQAAYPPARRREELAVARAPVDEERRSDGFTAVEDRHANYTVYDNDGDKIGKVDDLFLDENDQPEYFGVKMGFLGTRSTLIPAEIATTDEASSSITVSSDKETVKNGPAFDDDREITPEYEDEVHSYYGLGASSGTANRGSYGDETGTGDHSGAGTTGATSASTAGAGVSSGDTETGEFREHDLSDEGVGQSRGDDLDDRDELRVQRSEEELVAGTREREAGSVRVRKRVSTDRERIEVPVRHEEVTVERVPVEGEATEAQIGEDEVSVPVTEEEVVVDKRAVAKEEVRIRKDVVEGTEVVEEDVRREEIDVEDATERRPTNDHDV